MKQKGFTGILLIVGFIVILILTGTVFLLGKEALVQVNRLQSKPSAKVETQPTLTPLSPTPTLSSWQTYNNTQYNFELTYPKKGVVVKEAGYEEGECGDSITETAEKIIVDSFFEIKIIPWQGSLDEYLQQKGALDAYDFEQILDSGADEGIEVLGLKQDVSYAVGYPPLRFISHLFKKGDKIFLVEDFHKSEYFGGCLNPKTLDPVKYAQFIDLKWDLNKSFKFLP